MGNLRKIKKNVENRQAECTCIVQEIYIMPTYSSTFKYKCIECGKWETAEHHVEKDVLLNNFLNDDSGLSKSVHNKMKRNIKIFE